MKSVVLLALVAGASALTAQTQCLIPAKYASSVVAGACEGAKTGYIVEGFCAHPMVGVTGIALDTVTAARTQLTTANRLIFSSVNTALRNSGCNVPSDVLTWTTGTVATQQAITTSASACIAWAVTLTTVQTGMKGAIVRCDEANGYYVSAGIEGAASCYAAGAGYMAGLTAAATVDAYWTSQLHHLGTTSVYSNWHLGTLTCSLSCNVPAKYCTGNNIWHANVIALTGAGWVSNCRARPGTTATFYCKNNMHTAYAATCTANAVSTTAGTFAFENNVEPDCGAEDGASTPIYSLTQAVGFSAIPAGAVPGFSAASGTLEQSRAEVKKAAWGGNQRLNADFLDGHTYKVTVTGCSNNAECVQEAINWFRCKGLTIDAGTVCYAGSTTRIACPTHTNGYRCKDSSNKGLLLLLLLLILIPVCLIPLCILACILFLKPKKTSGDVQFATFDPHAAPIGGSFVAPGTACYAPSIGGIPTAVY